MTRLSHEQIYRVQQQENEAKWTMLGKMLTAAKELTTSTSPIDLLKKLHQ
ncbi:hypothetical protein [Paenibacillus sp. USHLN196]